MINILIYLKILLIYLFTNTNTPKGVLSTIVIFKDNFPGRKKSVWEYLLTTVINKNGFVVFAAVVCLFFILPVCAFAQEQTPSPGRKSIVIEHPAETLKDRLAREITIDIREMNAIDVLKFLALKGDFNVITSRQVAGRVTLYLKSVTIYDALEMVAISNNLAYHFENDIVHVMSAAEYEALFGKRFNDKTEVEIIKLDYARPSYVLAALDGIKSNWGRIIIDEDTGTVVIIDTAQSLKAMKSAIEEMESPLDVIVYPLQYAQAELVAMKFKARIDAHAVGSVTVDERTNKLIVRAFSGRREELEKLIKSLDTPTKEVLIEAKVMQVVFKPELDYGIDWNLDFRSSPEKQLSKLQFDNIFLDEDSLSSSSNLFSKYGRISFGDFDTDQFQMTIRALKQVSTTKILSNPKILVTNNEEAKIHVGDTVPYIISTTSGTGDNAITSESVQFVDVGLKLNVTPTINDDGFVTMLLMPEISTVVGQISSQGGGIPQVNKTSVATKVIVKDGMTVVLGGLKKENKINIRKGIPGLMDLPAIGKLFGSVEDTIEATEIVIFITPRIVSHGQTLKGRGTIKPLKGYGQKQVKTDLMESFELKP